MTGPTHYREAERLLEAAANGEPPGTDRLLAAAQVHATLALAAATALSIVTAVDVEMDQGPIVPPPHEEWSDVIL